jgi:Arc/MetJ-type ribon-helix-helix transcriptional regulator
VPRGTPLRNIRVSDDLWTAALVQADARGESLSEVIRRALRDYITEETATGHSDSEETLA